MYGNSVGGGDCEQGGPVTYGERLCLGSESSTGGHDKRGRPSPTMIVSPRGRSGPGGLVPVE